MPDHEGMEVIHQYTHEHHQKLPVIVISAFEKYCSLAKEFDNVVAVLEKPFDSHKLLAIIDEQTRWAGSEKLLPLPQHLFY